MQDLRPRSVHVPLCVLPLRLGAHDLPHRAPVCAKHEPSRRLYDLPGLDVDSVQLLRALMTGPRNRPLHVHASPSPSASFPTTTPKYTLVRTAYCPSNTVRRPGNGGSVLRARIRVRGGVTRARLRPPEPPYAPGEVPFADEASRDCWGTADQEVDAVEPACLLCKCCAVCAAAISAAALKSSPAVVLTLRGVDPFIPSLLRERSHYLPGQARDEAVRTARRRERGAE
ncbi:hypothetical protein NUW54_g14648 [Trametes sanguinea]|uniref:Uncharacterized protein n=1 Tax=Trametes sanguinea TaxID=158606 RepID=A0ACC1MBL4_9APHY|nr:hypothetical protein NUW54_g14648 [Trametes sanguinea]